MKKVYVASSGKMNATAEILLAKMKKCDNIEPFFPAFLGDYTHSPEEMRYIEAICDVEIERSNIMIAVYPFGLSVSNEIGRFLVYRYFYPDENRKLIIWDTSQPGTYEYDLLRSEAMIMPKVDHLIHDIDEAISLVQ